MKQSAKNLARAVYFTAKTDGASKAATGLFKLLQKKNQLKLLPQIFVALDDISADEGEIIVRVYSKTLLTNDQKSNIENRILKLSSGKSVAIESIIDSKIIGGIKIVFGDKTIDQTIKNKINKLRVAISA